MRARASRRRSAAVGVGTTSTPFRRRDLEVRGEQGHGRPTVACRLGERGAHPAGGAVPEEPDGVERLPCPAGGDEHAPAGERPLVAAVGEQRLEAARDLLRLAHPPRADEALRELAVLGADDHGAARGEQLDVRARRGVLPHRGVHRRREQQRAAVRERGLGEEVVREPVREPREGVRREGGDDERVGVLEVRVRVGRRVLARERPERLGRDEPLGPARHDRRDVVPGPHEQPDELARLVGRDAACHSEEDPRHARQCARSPHDAPLMAKRQCDRESGRLQGSARPKAGIKPRDSASAGSRLAS